MRGFAVRPIALHFLKIWRSLRAAFGRAAELVPFVLREREMIRRRASVRISLVAALLAFLPGAGEGGAQPAENRPAQWAQPQAPLAGAPNLFLVAPNFYRSAQPTAEGFRALSEQFGVKTAISMRANHSDAPLVRGTGIRTARFPTNTWSIDRASVIGALRVLRREAQSGVVLLHCQHGADRTGLVAALYRVLYQGWNKEDAIKEMQQGGYGYHAVWGDIPRFIRKVNVEQLRLSVAAP
jgi:hypothetical protein